MHTHSMTSQDRNLKTAFIYLIISILLMIAGAVYEHFSFGVYSYFMIYAFAIPLAGGTLPFLAKYMKSQRSNTAEESASRYCSNTAATMYHLAIATLTTGSIMHGILAICGRPNSLTVIYLIAGLLLLAVTALTAIRSAEKHTAI